METIPILNPPRLYRQINENEWLYAKEYIGNLINLPNNFTFLVNWKLKYQNLEDISNKENFYDIFYFKVENGKMIRCYEEVFGQMKEIKKRFTFRF